MSNMAPYDLWLDNTQQNSVPANMNSLRNEVLLISVTNTLNTPVGSEAENTVLIVGAAPTGAFTGWANQLVIKKSGVWFPFVPVAGMVKWHVALATYVRWTGSAWVDISHVHGGMGTALASAATTTLASATGDYVHVTGTTTITSFGSAKAGMLRHVTFDGILTITNNANITNIGGANITTAAGDSAMFRAEGGTVWKMVAYSQASGGPAMGAGTKGAFWRGDKVFSDRLVNEAGSLQFSLLAYGGSPGYTSGRANGTVGGETPTLNTQQIGSYAGFGHDGVAETANKARVRFVATGDWTPASTPTKMTFDTTPVGSTTITQRWSVEDTGHWLPTLDTAYDGGSATFRLRAVYTLDMNLSGAEFHTGIQSPAAIVADTNDMTVSATTRVMRLSSDATQRSITGFTGGASGRRLTLFNANASTPMLLKSDNASSALANRLLLGGADYLLMAGGSIEFWYDATTSRWRSTQSPQFGIYTPTLTNVANVAGSTAFACQWQRVGNVVTVSGRIDIDPTAASVNTEIGLSIPVPSNFASDAACCGSASPWAIAGVSAAILGDSVNDRAVLKYLNAADVAARAWFFHFTYLVI